MSACDTLTALIDANATDAGKELLATIGVRLAPGRIVIPDLAVGTYPDFFTVVDASAVVLACEVTSPGNAFNDRDIKKYLYAAAKIPWYLIVEPDQMTYPSITLHLLRLDGDKYVEHAVATHGETLTSDEPFPISISTVALLRR